MDNLREADPVSARTIGDAFNHWDDIDIHFKGRSLRSDGHGFIGIGRKKRSTSCRRAARRWA